MTDDSTIPVKSHNQRDALTGILYMVSEAQRTTETAAEGAARERAVERQLARGNPNTTIHAEVMRVIAQAPYQYSTHALASYVARKACITYRDALFYCRGVKQKRGLR